MIPFCGKPSLVFILAAFSLVVKLSSTSPIESGAEMFLVTSRLDTLQVKVDQLLYQLEEEKAFRVDLKALNEELHTRVNDLAAENQKHKEQINILIARSTHQEQEIHLLKTKNCNNDIIKSKSHETSDTKIGLTDDASSLSPRFPPSSCRQLSDIGHYLDGLYLVANSNTNKIETVYCDFGTGAISETLVGNLEVKTKSVHFYVQRSQVFSLNNVVIPFDIVRLNEGGGMNAAAGVFTVPVEGIYHFEFAALRDYSATGQMYVDLQVNGITLATSFSPNVTTAFLSLNGINASFRMKTGDQVRLYKTGGALDDNARHYTQFSGWLVEEDLVLVRNN